MSQNTPSPAQAEPAEDIKQERATQNEPDNGTEQAQVTQNEPDTGTEQEQSTQNEPDTVTEQEQATQNEPDTGTEQTQAQEQEHLAPAEEKAQASMSKEDKMIPSESMSEEICSETTPLHPKPTNGSQIVEGNLNTILGRAQCLFTLSSTNRTFMTGTTSDSDTHTSRSESFIGDENLLYVACSNTRQDVKDFIAVVDVDPASETYSRVVSVLVNEAFGPKEAFDITWAQNTKNKERYILWSSVYCEKVQVFHVQSDPRSPFMAAPVDEIKAEDIAKLAGYSDKSYREWFIHSCPGMYKQGAKLLDPGRIILGLSRACDFESNCFAIVNSQKFTIEKAWRWPEPPSCLAVENGFMLSCHGTKALHIVEPLNLSDLGMHSDGLDKFVKMGSPEESLYHHVPIRETAEVAVEAGPSVSPGPSDDRRGSSTSAGISSIESGLERSYSKAIATGARGNFACGDDTDESNSIASDVRPPSKLDKPQPPLSYGTPEWWNYQRFCQRKFQLLIEDKQSNLSPEEKEVIVNFLNSVVDIKDDLLYDKSLYKSSPIYLWNLIGNEGSKKDPKPLFTDRKPWYQLPMKVRFVPSGTNPASNSTAFIIYGISGTVVNFQFHQAIVRSSCLGLENSEPRVHEVTVPAKMSPVRVANWDVLDEKRKPLQIAPALPSDLAITEDGKFLFVCNYLRGDIVMFEIAQNRKLLQRCQLFVGGIFANGHATFLDCDLDELPLSFVPPKEPVPDTESEKPESELIVKMFSQPEPLYVKDRKIEGGPANLELSSNGTRLFVTHSLYPAWDKQFYKDTMMTRGGTVIVINVDYQNGTMSVDRNFLIDLTRGSPQIDGTIVDSSAVPRGMLLFSDRRKKKSHKFSTN